MSISDIVQISITTSTSPVARASFGTALILGENMNIDNRLAYYTSPTSALAAVIGTDTREESMISDIFAQNPRVTRIALGAVRTTKVVTLTGTMTAGSISATINGTTVTQAFTSDEATTFAALQVKIEALADVDASSTQVGSVFTEVPASGLNIGVTFDISAATGLTAQATTVTSLSEDFDDALDAILLEQSNWYGVLAAVSDNERDGSSAPAQQEKVADWVESNKKFFIAGSSDANIVNQNEATDTTSIAHHANSNSLARTAVIYTSNADTEAPDAALMGKILPLDPGTYTAMLKTLASVTVDSLTATQVTNAHDKNANTYETIGGVNVTRKGTCGDGEFIDVQILIDWIESNVQTEVYSVLVNSSKVPYTDDGINAVVDAISKPLQIAQNRGGISPTSYDSNDVQIGGYFVTAPLASAVSSTDKANRELNDVEFTAFLAGAIHKVVINGIVTL